MRVRVWGKADEYPYKCTTLSLSPRDKRPSSRRARGELAASKHKVTALEAQLSLQERAATRGAFTDTAVEHPTTAAAAPPPGRPINSASSDIDQAKDGDTTDEDPPDVGTEGASGVDVETDVPGAEVVAMPPPLTGAPGAAGSGQELTAPPGRSRHAVLKKITERSRP